MRVVFAGFICLLLGGCASVVRGTDEQIAFSSDPGGATVTLSTGQSCVQTPCAIKVPRKDDFTATFAKSGYQQQSVSVPSHLSGAGVGVGAGNILLGGVVGVGVDAYTGANLDHMPNPVTVVLHPTPAARSSKRHVPVS